MSFARPALTVLIDRAIADMEARLPGADVRLATSNLNVLAHLSAGAAHGLYGYLDWIARQILPDTSEAEILARQATIWGIGRKPAAAASGSVSFSGVGTVPAGTLLQRSDGWQYQTTAEAVLPAAASVLAVGLGSAGNAAAGSALALVSPLAGITAATVATGGLTGAADIETDDALRARLLARIQQPPQGGCAYDYVAWALAVPGVSRAWVYPQELGLGTVTVRFMRGLDASPIPDAAAVAEVQAHLEALRPVAVQVTVVAPVAVALDFVITGLNPGTTAVKVAVLAELQDVITREAVPGGTLLVSHLRAAISAAAGETDYVLTSPSANVTHSTGQIATLGAVTWA